MKRKMIGLIVLSMFLIFAIQRVSSTGISVYASVNTEENRTESIMTYLDIGNYSVYVNIDGDLRTYGWSTSQTGFSIIKDEMTYLSVMIQGTDDSLPYVIERRLTITESGNYNFSFFLDEGEYSSSYSETDYANYEVILTDIVIVYHPKTNIIAEAPYGLGIIGLALIGIACVYIRRRRTHTED